MFNLPPRIGVLLGHRRIMLAAIAGLNDMPAVAASAQVAVPPLQPIAVAAPPPASAEPVGERRHVTVMFSDLVGSTALSARMDPEDLREVISTYQKCVAETVRRFDGFVAKYLGDGVLVYFGYPQAHEDDAERAVRAGLELVASVSALKSPSPLQTRVGIATGLVVVGDVIRSGEAQESLGRVARGKRSREGAPTGFRACARFAGGRQFMRGGNRGWTSCAEEAATFSSGLEIRAGTGELILCINGRRVQGNQTMLALLARLGRA
jgi:class 3 adenylate cyclase